MNIGRRYTSCKKPYWLKAYRIAIGLETCAAASRVLFTTPAALAGFGRSAHLDFVRLLLCAWTVAIVFLFTPKALRSHFFLHSLHYHQLHGAYYSSSFALSLSCRWLEDSLQVRSCFTFQATYLYFIKKGTILIDNY
jgi:hypothetical protein